METKDITNTGIRNIGPRRLMIQASKNIVIMTFPQFQKIICQRTKNETQTAIQSIFNKTTYLGFFKDSNTEGFSICIFTGKEIPSNLDSNWIRIANLRIATTRNTDLPLIIYSVSRTLAHEETLFTKTLFKFVATYYSTRNPVLYNLSSRKEKLNYSASQIWYWVYAKAVGIIETIEGTKTPIANLLPVPGPDDTILFIDRARNAHQFTFNWSRINPSFIKIGKPNVFL